MIAAYVLGRPMPSFSSVLTSDASLKRGGGSVKCCVGFSFSKIERLGLRHRRQHDVFLLADCT